MSARRDSDRAVPARRHLRGFLLAACAIALVGAVASPTGAGPLSSSGGSATPTASTPPNLILILTDDERWDEMVNMPIVQNDIVAHGINFPNAFVVNPSCCPSRTTILTGKYSHGTDVYTNKPPHGGFPTFEPEEGSTLATWLHDGGYHTGLFGKYLNEYQVSDVPHVPPGWDDWAALTFGADESGPEGYNNYTLSVGNSSVGGSPEFHGNGFKQYSTDVLGQKATDFITNAPVGQPLFLYYAPYAPHSPTKVPKRYKTACPSLSWTNPPSFNESAATLNTKPKYARRRAELTQKAINKINTHRFKDCRSLLAVDDWVGNITDALQATGRLDNSLIVFMSDNGYLFGEHRRTGKIVPYEESIRVPMAIRYDPMTGPLAGTTNPDLVLNLDIAPTFAAAGGVSAPGAVGESLLPLLTNPSAPWRDHFLVEHWGEGGVPAYCAIRTADWKYVLYATGEEELYYLSGSLANGDGPYELVNQASNPADPYHSELLALRTVEQQMCVPQPPGGLPTP